MAISRTPDRDGGIVRGGGVRGAGRPGRAGRTPTRRARRGAVEGGRIVALVAVLAGAASASGVGVVRNTAPERTAAPYGVEWPASYPRAGRTVTDPGAVGPTAEHRLRHFITLHSACRYDDALSVILELIDETGDHPSLHYNHACVLARVHRTDAAIAALEAAVRAGWRGDVHAAIDPDLAVLRRDARFRQTLQNMRRLAREEELVPGPLRAEPLAQTITALDARVPRLLERWRVPGVTVAIIEGGDLAWSGGYGRLTARKDVRLAPDGRFQLTAPAHLLLLVTALRLEDDGRLDVSNLLLDGERLAERHSGRTLLARRRPGPRRTAGGTEVLLHALGPIEQRRGGPPVSGRTPGGRWPVTTRNDTVIRLLAATIELAGRATAAECCAREILRPLALEATTFGGSGAPMAETDRSPACIGHSSLGTPILPVPGRPDVAATPSVMSVDITAPELARLIGRLMTARDSTVEGIDGAVVAGTEPADRGDTWRAPTERLLELSGFELGRLGLGVHARSTADGPCLELADVRHGAGCYARWYPRLGRGVVVLFNSGNGPDAALRIARIALGGE